MHRKTTLGKALLALILPVALAGAAFAGGADCKHGKEMAAGGEKGEHCPLAKNVKKVATMTDDGAIVTLSGKNDEAINHIQAHMKAHQNGGTCPDCPLSMAGITTTVEMTKNGGVLTVKGNSPETIKAVQEWANRPAGACCGKGHETDKA